MMAMSFASSSASSCTDGSTNFGMDEPALCNMTAAGGGMQGRAATCTVRRARCNACDGMLLAHTQHTVAGTRTALSGNAVGRQCLREAARLAVGRAERLFELRRTLLLDLFQLRLRSA